MALPVLTIELGASRPGIEKQGIVLKVYDKAFEGSKAFRAELCHVDGHTENCIAVPKKRAAAIEIFKILNSLSHPNVAQPIGLWGDPETRTGYIIFQKFDGVLSTLPETDIFEVERPPGQTPAMYGFTKAGLNILWDTVAAVEYINNNYQQETQGDNLTHVKALKIEKDTVFYQQKAEGEYLVLLSDFEVDVVQVGKKSKGSSGSGHEKAGSSGEDQDMHKIKSRNWNNLGKFIEQLYEGLSPKSEVTHLIDLLREKTVKYENIIWEAGLWDLSTKLHFIREIFWCYDKNEDRIKQLKKRVPLGLQSCIDMLEDVAWEGYNGPKVDIMDKKAVERFVLRHRDDYMVRLIREIRGLNWIATSPFLRRNSEYMSVHYHTTKGK